MKMTQEHQRVIEGIKSEMTCPKDFECCRSGFERLGNVGIIGDGEMIECIDENAGICEFGDFFGLGYLCKCPLRNYIARNFHR